MKAVIYTRASIQNQDTDRQVRELEQVAKAKGHEVIEIIISEQSSSISDKRQCPSIKRLMSLADQRAFQTLLVFDLSRLGRNTSEVRNVINELTEKNINIHIWKLGVDTITHGNPLGQILMAWMEEFASLERESRIQRIKSGIKNANRRKNAKV